MDKQENWKTTFGKGLKNLLDNAYKQALSENIKRGLEAKRKSNEAENN